MALYPLEAPKSSRLPQPNTVTQARLHVPKQTQASPPQAKQPSPIKNVVHAKEDNPSWLGTSTEPKFAKKAEATSQEYRNPNADRDGVVRIDSQLTSSDVIELNDKEANPEKEDVAQQVQIAAIGPMDKETKSLEIDLGDKDSLQSVEEAIVKDIQVGDEKSLRFLSSKTASRVMVNEILRFTFPIKT
jgi:hypothetical protein